MLVLRTLLKVGAVVAAGSAYCHRTPLMVTTNDVSIAQSARKFNRAQTYETELSCKDSDLDVLVLY